MKRVMGFEEHCFLVPRKRNWLLRGWKLTKFRHQPFQSNEIYALEGFSFDKGKCQFLWILLDLEGG